MDDQWVDAAPTAPADDGWVDAPAAPLAQLQPKSWTDSLIDLPNQVIKHSANLLNQEGDSEALHSFASSMGAQLKAGLHGLDAFLTSEHPLDSGLSEATDAINKSLKDSEKDVYQPESEAGKAAMETIGLPAKLGAAAGSAIIEHPEIPLIGGSPLAATIADIGLQNAPFMAFGGMEGAGEHGVAPKDVGLDALKAADQPTEAAPEAAAPQPTEVPAAGDQGTITPDATLAPKPHYTAEQVARGEHLQPDTPDQSGVPKSVYKYVHDMQDSNSGLNDIHNYSPDEQAALRSAGLVKKAELPSYTDEDGDVIPAREHEGVDRNDLIPERERRYQAEVAAMKARADARKQAQTASAPLETTQEPEEQGQAAANLERLTDLREKRKEGLTPDERDEYTDLLEKDAFQGMVKGNGAPIEGTGNADALNHYHDMDETPQVHIDLDNFKPINDTLGHPAGDTLIQHAGETLAKEFPPDENGVPSVFHHGGDEFTIVPKEGETLADVQQRAETVREQIKNTPIELTDTTGQTSVHPGVDFSLGAGETHADASASLTRDKAAREASGIRRPRYNRSTDTPGAPEGAADRVAAGAERPPEQVTTSVNHVQSGSGTSA